MNSRPRFRRAGLTWSCAAALWLSFAGGAPGADETPVRFSRDVLPILSDHCFSCHGPDAGSRKANLRLDTREGATAARAGGRAAVEPGNPEASALLRHIEATDPEEVMPPPEANRPLSTAQKALLRRWIAAGAPWGQHWAFEPPQPQPPPTVRAASWPRTPVDRFLLARLETEGLAPAPEAPRDTLIRRLSLDLTGLPPGPAEVDAFRADPRPDAYEQLVERLLASPRFGERMAWDWLDAARYADSNGYQGDSERTMWPWRDWVTRALNANLPFDDFTVWQLAGDLLPGADREQVLATGFQRNHMINGEGGRIPEENRVDYIMDMVETTGTVWLGLTLNCCRCHDHKFDPLKQRDYYSLFAYFNQTPVDGSGGNPQTPPVLEAPSAAQADRRGVLEAEHAATAAAVAERENALPAGTECLPEEIRQGLAVPPSERDRGRLETLAAFWKDRDADYAGLLERLRHVLAEREGLEAAVARVMVMADQETPRETFILSKGLYDQPRDRVTADVPESFPPLPPEAPPNRLGLAQWLVAPENPLTARVIVNRAWQQLFGIGLVKTPEDFGLQGERPAHPELLDWLAAEFVRSGWDFKALCRLLVTSSAYRQSSRSTPGLAERDPANRLLARGPRFRLPFWMLRDQALAASGLLADPVGGPPVKPYQPAGVWEEATFGNKTYAQDHGEALYRRSLYVFWRRIVGPPMFFDNASRQTCTVKVARTNTPLQSLATLNDVTYVEAARALAQRALRESPDPPARVTAAFRRVLGRSPHPEELALLTAAAERYRARFAADPDAAQRLLAAGESPRDDSLDPAEHAAYTVVCSTILNLDETLTKE